MRVQMMEDQDPPSLRHETARRHAQSRHDACMRVPGGGVGGVYQGYKFHQSLVVVGSGGGGGSTVAVAIRRKWGGEFFASSLSGVTRWVGGGEEIAIIRLNPGCTPARIGTVSTYPYLGYFPGKRGVVTADRPVTVGSGDLNPTPVLPFDNDKGHLTPRDRTTDQQDRPRPRRCTAQALRGARPGARPGALRRRI
eukprot:747261-Hanusia_phi.AAC.7